jgi:hypothetical protein
MLVYKIKNQDGLFSTGGTRPYFNKTGKTWSNIGHIKTHLKQFYNSSSRKWNLPPNYNGAEVCFYAVSFTHSRSVSLESYTKSLDNH